MPELRAACARVPGTCLELDGTVGRYLKAVTEQWLLVAPLANPAILEMYRDRDAPPQRHLEPWAGEFAGKYLTAAVQVLRARDDPRLRAFLETFVSHLIGLQAADGYLGPWPTPYRLSNRDPNQRPGGMITWDTWGHYHLMLGLLLWYEESGDGRTLESAARIGDLICQVYLGHPDIRLVDTGCTEMNLAPVHSLCLLYRRMGRQRYLDMALQIVDEFGAQGADGPLAGDYLHQALAGREFYQMPRPRWESLHPIMGLAELYHITGHAPYRQAFEHLWASIRRSDRHNNGGFSSGEQASGDPYDRGAIETCCTIAWIALSVEMLRLSGLSLVADEIELSTLNSVLGLHSASGRWATYDTPMDGVRRASGQSIVFQAREGSPELNCCSVSGPRGLGMISDWALMTDGEGLILNYYGPARMIAEVRPGLPVTLTQDTDYPHAGRIDVRVDLAQAREFALRLRIPCWSTDSRVSINGQPVRKVTAGSYYTLRRTWQPGDVVEIDLDMRPHFWPGERECVGLTSVYHGPILLTYDHRYNLDLAADGPPVVRDKEQQMLVAVPALDADMLDAGWPVVWGDWLPPWLLYEVEAVDGQPVRLCDFGSAGETGTPYRSWLPVSNVPARSFIAPASCMPDGKEGRSR